MRAERVLVIAGHPDPSPSTFIHALASAYAAGAAEAGLQVRRIDIGALDFPLIRSAAAFEKEAPPPAIQDAQAAITWAQHIVILHPLWLGEMPALLKAFLEQTLRYGFALASGERPAPLLKGKSVRIVVTMGMPGVFYRLWFGAHSVRALARVLGFCGMGPVRINIVGAVEAMGQKGRAAWLARMRAMGAQAA
jgi:putative NADPH-quinone reductase